MYCELDEPSTFQDEALYSPKVFFNQLEPIHSSLFC